jgi:hypothetical protein
MILGSGIAYQYLSLRRRSDEHRAFVEHRLNALEVTLLEDSARQTRDILAHTDGRFEEVLHDTREIKAMVSRALPALSRTPAAL